MLPSTGPTDKLDGINYMFILVRKFLHWCNTEQPATSRATPPMQRYIQLTSTTSKTDLNGQPTAPAEIQQFIDQQLDYMDYMVGANPNDIFWTYVGYYLEQFRYLHVGYMKRIKSEGKMEMALDFKMIYLLPYMGDMEDFIAYDPDWVSIVRKNCNAYIKWNGKELYSTHQTQTRFTFMLRIYKHWNFPR